MATTGLKGGKAKVRSADAFRTEMNQASPTLLRNVTRAMYPILHPALQARKYTEDIDSVDIDDPIRARFYSSAHL